MEAAFESNFGRCAHTADPHGADGAPSGNVDATNSCRGAEQVRATLQKFDAKS